MSTKKRERELLEEYTKLHKLILIFTIFSTIQNVPITCSKQT